MWLKSTLLLLSSLMRLMLLALSGKVIMCVFSLFVCLLLLFFVFVFLGGICFVLFVVVFILLLIVTSFFVCFEIKLLS